MLGPNAVYKPEWNGATVEALSRLLLRNPLLSNYVQHGWPDHIQLDDPVHFKTEMSVQSVCLLWGSWCYSSTR